MTTKGTSLTENTSKCLWKHYQELFMRHVIPNAALFWPAERLSRMNKYAADMTSGPTKACNVTLGIFLPGKEFVGQWKSRKKKTGSGPDVVLNFGTYRAK